MAPKQIVESKRCTAEIQKKFPKNQNIFILSDSQAAIKSLISYEIKSKLVLECQAELNKLALNNKVTIEWVPGHKGYEGNEKADELAKRGADSPLTGPEPFLGTPICNIKQIVNKWEETKKSEFWSNTPGQLRSKLFMPLHSKVKSKNLITLSRDKLRVLVSIFTGHCKLNYHQNKIGKIDNKLCRFCNEKDETPEHILCDCGPLIWKRLQIMETFTIQYREICKLDPGKILEFFHCLGVDL